MPRVHSAENIASSQTSVNSQPVAAPRRDSISEKDVDGAPKPKPAPRRNVQSCYIEPTSQPPSVPPPVVPRPQSIRNRGELPTLPNNLPETSSNYYSSVEINSKTDMEKDTILNGSDIRQNDDVSEPTEYGTLWDGKPSGSVTPAPPVVPKRKDLIPDGGESILDKPLSPDSRKTVNDPFDTSAITQMLPKNVPLMPTHAAGQSQDTAPIYNMPAVPPRPVAEQVQTTDSLFNEFDSFNQAPSSPPPSPPKSSPPGLPPPPPLQEKIQTCAILNQRSRPLFQTCHQYLLGPQCQLTYFHPIRQLHRLTCLQSRQGLLPHHLYQKDLQPNCFC